MIRPATAADAAAVERVHLAAFAGDEEARLAREVPAEISLVAEADGELVGHVLVSRAHVDSAPVLALGPIGVLPAWQRRGVGSLLMEAAIAEADARGEPLIALLGHPWYYPRFGFRQARGLGIEPPFEVADEVWMALPLAAYDPELRGRFSYHPGFG
jgi:putative acetyltransferase